jgi:alpha-amylase
MVMALAGVRLARGTSCTVTPANPVSGQTATITYDPAGGPLAGDGTIEIHRGINNWSPVAAPDQPMTQSNGVYVFSYTVPPEGYQINVCFNNGSGTWDNNNLANWNFALTRGPAPTSLPSPPALPSNASTADVMMEGFYWNCPSGWYSTMSAAAAQLRNMMGGQGIDRIWFPPPSKAASGGDSMGYDPYDYYDLGSYNQEGTTDTHFGSQTDLKNAIAAFHTQGIVCLADLVLNHRTGGASETNPNVGSATYTDFSKVSSHQCTWHYNQFHPSTFENSDETDFGGFPDLCHVTGNTAGCAYYDIIQWAKWLTNTANAGFDGGWRFDDAMAYYPWVAMNVRSNTANAFGVGEYWDYNVTDVDSYVTYSGGTWAFDFPGYNTMVNVFSNGASIASLVNPAQVYAARNPARAVTFIANHDTDRGSDTAWTNKMLAYAFILTYQGYPCIFWYDYFNNGFSTLGGQTGNGINRLVWVRGALGGQRNIQLLETDDTDLLVYGALGGTSQSPGYIVAINNNPNTARSATVTTSNIFLCGRTLQCYAWYSYAANQNTQPASVACSSSGVVTVQAAPNGYAIFAPAAIPAPSLVPPQVSCALTNSLVQIAWPSQNTGWRLQASANSLKNWATVAGSTNVDQVSVPLISTNGSVFYRLVYP